MKILVLNSGSSSLKYQLLDMDSREVLASGLAERIGGEGSRLIHRESQAGERRLEAPDYPAIPDHRDALTRIAQCMNESGLAAAVGTIDGVGHRVVHGGETFVEPTRIDTSVVSAIRELSSLAPLHNPANLQGIEAALEALPDVPQVAVFDTAFHATIPAHAHRYAVPQEWYESYKVRRYGFHGTSHAYVARRAAEFLERPPEELDLIVLHLGNGASAAAISGGQSIDTSMGLTPLEGLVMGTRSGDLDPALIFHVARQAGLSLDEVDEALNRSSGLAGLCGVSDMRDALEREAAGDTGAELAIAVYTYRIRKYIGAYLAALGRLDAIAFTAGIGENSPQIRERVCAGLDGLGIRIDRQLNQARGGDARAINPEGSDVQVLIVPTNEELEIAAATRRCIRRR